MSVPAHAPFDYLALRDLYDADLSEYGITEDLRKIELISLIQVPEFGEFPAKEIVESMGISDQKDPKAEEATKSYTGESSTEVSLRSSQGNIKDTLFQR